VIPRQLGDSSAKLVYCITWFCSLFAPYLHLICTLFAPYLNWFAVICTIIIIWSHLQHNNYLHTDFSRPVLLLWGLIVFQRFWMMLTCDLMMMLLLQLCLVDEFLFSFRLRERSSFSFTRSFMVKFAKVSLTQFALNFKSWFHYFNQWIHLKSWI
jgi:hypothetical protein